MLLALGVLLIALLPVYWSGDGGLFDRKGFGSSAHGVLVLEDCDSDYTTPPFEDAVMVFDPNGKPVRKVTGLNICETVGGCRSLSVSKDGRFFTVCENVAHKLTAYEMNTGERLWSLDGEFTAATVSQTGFIYALASAGTIYGNQLLQIDQAGRVRRQAVIGGFDLAMDDERKALWLVGNKIKKCNLECTVLFEINSIRWCAVSVDLARDGSAWVAEREHSQVAGSTNRLIQISPEGKTLKAVGLPFTPFCLRVDRADGSVWITGEKIQNSAAGRMLGTIETRTGHLPIGKKFREFLMRPRVWSITRKYDMKGALLCDFPSRWVLAGY